MQGTYTAFKTDVGFVGGDELSEALHDS